MSLEGLNEQQVAAVVESFDTNTLVIAGAGSGKTHTLTCRVKYILETLGASEEEIMLVTFTNKAAKEIKTRMYEVTGEVEKMMIGTFHSVCLKLLKEYGDYIGINRFSILDTYKSRKLITELLDKYGEQTDKGTVSKYISKISRFKSELINPKLALEKAQTPSDVLLGKVYKEYQDRCWKDKTFDYDDLIVYTIVLLTRSEAVRDDVRYRYKYVMVDEAQDSNSAQFSLIKVLVGDNNLFLVGDDAQSIYKFRAAKPEYIMNLTHIYPDAKVLKLDRNYRSTQTIVNASNALVNHNTVGFKKECYSKNAIGDPILYYEALSAEDEAKWVVTEAMLLQKAENIKFEDIAILYRTNSQSRIIEEACMKMNVPVKLTGGVSFYSRKEIKDILSFAKFMADGSDEESFTRALSSLPGIGKTSVTNIVNLSKLDGISLLDAANSYKCNKKGKVAIDIFNEIVNIDMKTPLGEIIEHIAIKSKIVEILKNEGTEDAMSRLGNIKELINIAIDRYNENNKATIDDLLSYIALFSNEEGSGSKDGIQLMTIHASKGLEFEAVFVVGMDEDILPHQNNKKGLDVEEERRLGYVALSRAKNRLFISHCQCRTDGGMNRIYNPSRFISEIPNNYILKV